MEQNSKTEILQSNGGDEESTKTFKVIDAEPVPESHDEEIKNPDTEANIVVKLQKSVASNEQETVEALAVMDAKEFQKVQEVEKVEEVEELSSESDEEAVASEKEKNDAIEKIAESNKVNKTKGSLISDNIQEETKEEAACSIKKVEAIYEEKDVRELLKEVPRQRPESVADKPEGENSCSIDLQQDDQSPNTAKVDEKPAENQDKQEIVVNTIKEIISDIDSNIREQEKISQLKQEELKLLKKQQELAQQIEQQQLLARKLETQNDIMQQKYQQEQQQLQQQRELQEQQQFQQQQLYQKKHQQQQRQQQLQHQNQLQHQDIQNFQSPHITSSKYSTHEESKDGNTITKRTESYETQESANVNKRIDLQKIFTPATDVEEILPKNRKLYSSSAFYSPTLHPTVEDQVELARRISHSLSDISNQQSKGQSMYVNRKKRSVKWVHEGQAEETTYEEYCDEQQKENAGIHTINESEIKRTSLDKVPLRLLMNPRGQIRDYNSLRDSLNIETGLLSPEKCAELVTALQTHKGRGAELFAKRRKKADNWVVDEYTTSTHSPSGLPDNHPYQAASPRPPTSPSLLPAYSDAGRHRVQLNIHQEQVLEKYAKPGLKVVKSPWEAALESGSASAAFIEESKSQQHSFALTPSPVLQETSYQGVPSVGEPVRETQQYPSYKSSPYNDQQRDLAYKPNIPQGWKAPSVSLPKELYVPKEIPLESYAAPPVVNIKQTPNFSSYGQPQTQKQHTWKPTTSPMLHFSPYDCSVQSNSEYHNTSAPTSSFPINRKPYIKNEYAAPQMNFPVSTNTPPKQQYWEPTKYPKVSPTVGAHGLQQVNFNPSPLPYEKLAKFEGTDNDDPYRLYSSPQAQRYLSSSSGSKVRNIPPASYDTTNVTQYLCQPHSLAYQGRLSPSKFSTFNTLNPKELLHAPTYNSSAQGWNSAKGRSNFSSTKLRTPLTIIGDIPYSDF